MIVEYLTYSSNIRLSRVFKTILIEKKKADSLELYITREIFNRDIEFLFTDEFLLIIIALITMKITRYMMKINDRYMKIYIGDFVHLLCCSMAINS